MPRRWVRLTEKLWAGFDASHGNAWPWPMLMALVFDEPHGGMTAMKALFDAGIYAFFASYDPSVLQFKPVLTLTDDEADEIISIVTTTFGRQRGPRP